MQPLMEAGLEERFRGDDVDRLEPGHPRQQIEIRGPQAAAIGGEHYFDWGGGLIWLGLSESQDGGAAIVRGAIAGCGGHATLIRGPLALRGAVDVFQPEPPALAALTARVKESFDPRRILNPGRMYPGV